MRVAGCELRVASCGLRVAGCELRVAGCEDRQTGVRHSAFGIRGYGNRAWGFEKDDLKSEILFSIFYFLISGF